MEPVLEHLESRRLLSVTTQPDTSFFRVDAAVSPAATVPWMKGRYVGSWGVDQLDLTSSVYKYTFDVTTQTSAGAIRGTLHTGLGTQYFPMVGVVRSDGRFYLAPQSGPDMAFFGSVSASGKILTGTLTMESLTMSGRFLFSGSKTVDAERPPTTGGIAVSVFEDLNRNGERDGVGFDEWFIRGQRVFIDYNANGRLDAQEPSLVSQGNEAPHILKNLRPGRYFVQVQPSNGMVSTGASRHVVTVTAGGVVGAGSFCVAPAPLTATTGAIRGVVGIGTLPLLNRKVYIDYDNDAVRDKGEPYATTDAQGVYLLPQLRPGRYRVRPEVHVEMKFNAPLVGQRAVTVTAGQLTAGAGFDLAPADSPDPDRDDQISEANGLGPLQWNVTTGSKYTVLGTDVDMFRFSVKAGDERKFRVTGDGELYLRLFGADGTVLVESPGSGSFEEFSHKFLAAGAYFLGVSTSRNMFYDPIAGNGDSPGFNFSTTGEYTLSITQ